MNVLIAFVVGAVAGAVATWIHKNHLIHEADKLKAAAQKAVPRI